MDNDGPQQIIIPKTQISKKIRRYLQLAKKLAATSTYGNFRHGAILTSSGSAIIGMGTNNEKYCSVGAKYRSSNKGHATYHAEIASIMHLERDVTKGATIYVARIAKGSGEDRMSKPCPMCHAVLEAQGIKKVSYTIDEENVGFYKIN